MHRWSNALAWLLLVAFRAGATAQAVRPVSAWQLTVDNDLIALRGAGPPPDFDYTHGTRLTMAVESAPGWLRRLGGNTQGCRSILTQTEPCLTASVELGQEIFTPRRDSTEPVPGERPYAGWLYAGGTVSHVRPTRIRSLRIALGVTGEPSLAETVQRGIHRAFGNMPQRGWAHQLASHAGVVVSAAEERTHRFSLGATALALGGMRIGATVGNVRTAAAGSLTLEISRPTNRTIRSPLAPGVDHALGWYSRLAVGGDAVGHDLFLSGVERLTRRPFVGDVSACVGFRARGAAVQYCHVRRGREYDSQPAPHSYGRLSLAVHRF